jgi:Flp pilus assembly protein TadG
MRPRCAREDGGILVMTALVLMVLLGVTALAIDAGSLYEARNRMSAAADAAAVNAAKAMAGGASCVCDTPCATLTNYAQDAVTRSGFANADVTLNHSPTSGAFNGNCNYVEAVVSRSVPTHFLRAFNGTSGMTVTARAVAGGVESKPPCIVTINPADNVKGIDISAGTITMPGCVVQDNATGGSAMTITGTMLDVHRPAGPPHGSVWVSGDCQQGVNCKDKVNPSANLHTGTGEHYDDFLSGTPAPWAPGSPDPCTGASVGQSKSDSAVPPHTYKIISTSTASNVASLQHGIYCGGITSFSGSATTAANPAGGPTIVIIYGGTFDPGGGELDNTGVAPVNEVCVYITGAASGTWKYGSGSTALHIASGNVNMKAPRSGDQEGIVIFFDRNNPKQGNISGGTANLEGFIYQAYPDTQVPGMQYSGGASSPWVQYNLLVVSSLKFSGGSVLKNNVPVLSGASWGGSSTRLVE